MSAVDLTKCSLNSVTVREATFPELLDLAVEHGFGGVGLWRDSYAEHGVTSAARRIARTGLRVTSVCRGGLFPQPTPELRARAHEDNLRAIDEAHELNADCLVLVCGPAHDRDLAGARAQIADGVEGLLEHAAAAAVPLAVEPMHPMMAADRSAITSLHEAVDLVELIDSPWAGLAVDSYHVWWDVALPQLLERSGPAVRTVQLADWVLPIHGQLNSRGMPGEGHIDMAQFVELSRRAGYRGLIEVEVLSDHWWSRPPEQVARAAASALAGIPAPGPVTA